jgi:hypothetical protein
MVSTHTRCIERAYDMTEARDEGVRAVTDEAAQSTTGDGVLTYRERTWTVQSEPVVIDSDGGSDLVEVWVRRGEGIEQPQ